MLYSKDKIKTLTAAYKKLPDIEDEIALNILGFIDCIHLNKQDFITSSYKSEYYGNLSMRFLKSENQVAGLVHVVIKNEHRIIDYLFTDKGFDQIDDLLALNNQK